MSSPSPATVFDASQAAGARPETVRVARSEARRVLRKAGRRLLSAVVRGRVGAHPWADDRRNFFSLLWNRRASFGVCPLCGWQGVFLQHAGRPRQICLVCGSRARHRTLALAVRRQLGEPLAAQRALHIAPEACLAPLLVGCRQVVTGDLEPGRGDVALDLRCLPFGDAAFDLVLASHVLEHIVEDRLALLEVARVLRPGGLAILPVPITAQETSDFGFVDPARNHHARECGPDYLERYREAGLTVDVVRSDQLPDADAYSLATLEDGPRARVEHWIPICRKAPEKPS